MIACVDVDYRENEALAACVLFRDWADEHSAGESVERVLDVEAYQPGQFYKRELPCLLAVLGRLPDLPVCVVVDGYAWLGPNRPGLGARLFEALGSRIPVIGVAKTSFQGARPASVRRPGSEKPLFVTAVGVDLATAAQQVASMHGPFRIPTLLRRVDQLARGLCEPAS
jgi:deoxyribonuclease V